MLALVVPAALGAQAMFRGDPAHSGRSGETGPATLKGVKWTVKTGGPVVSSPVLVDGTLYVGSDDGSLYAVEAGSGATKWKFATEGYVRSTPAIVDGTAYFGSYDGFIYAVDAATGQLRWKFETAGERKFSAKGLHGSRPKQQVIADAWDCYLSSPTVVDGRVHVGSGDGHVYALDARSGELRWKFATQDVVHASPAVVDGVVYVGSWDTFLYALDATNGALKWKFKTGEDPENHNQEGIQSSPTVVEGVVYFGCRDFHLYAVEAQTGTQRWKHKITWINATPTVRDGRVYASTSIPSMFFALDAQTGEEVYRVELGAPAFSSPTLAGDLAFVGSFNGRLYAVDLAGRKIAWVYETDAAKANVRQALTPEGQLNSPVLFPSRFFEKMTVAVDHLLASGAILSSPAVEQGRVYFGSADGAIYALE
ncbi:Pyrrolo-quinoline quinone [Opitutus terrae PB90-1]|uniref:Pyrrolo-quinoline quinone n=2 Tax=Opitutus terrae TaxID=107709 RepID=B1ZZA3_OPITP|nr:Pyrrolo-quinoline quinone [Opitutus terrae PB90-1]